MISSGSPLSENDCDWPLSTESRVLSKSSLCGSLNERFLHFRTEQKWGESLLVSIHSFNTQNNNRKKWEKNKLFSVAYPEFVVGADSRSNNSRIAMPHS